MSSKKSGTSLATKLIKGVRKNIIGIQMLSKTTHEQLFPKGVNRVTAENFEAAKLHLQQHELWGKEPDAQPPIELTVPGFKDASLDSYFKRIGKKYSEPYFGYAKNLASVKSLPKRPDKWLSNSGWTKYIPGKPPQSVPFPSADDTALVLDVEVLTSIGPYPTLAIAVSKNAWYAWVGEGLSELMEKKNSQVKSSTNDDNITHDVDVKSPKFQQLIPLGSHETKSQRVIIGHNVGYDRIRIKDEYNFLGSLNRFIDTMSLHIICSGLSTQQKISWLKVEKSRAAAAEFEEEEEEDDDGSEWFSHGSTNSLAQVYKQHCSGELNKEARSHFVEGTINDIVNNFDILMNYCANDVDATFQVFQKVFLKFLVKCPHPVTFAGMLEMGTAFLPTNSKFSNYIEQCDKITKEIFEDISKQLRDIAYDVLKGGHENADAWTKTFDWTVKEIKYTKPRYKKDGTYAKNGEPRPIKQRLAGYPKWFIDLCPPKSEVPEITARSRIAPYLLRLEWNGYPVRYLTKMGWGYIMPMEEAEKLEPDKKGYQLLDEGLMYFKIPHKSGPKYPVGNILAKTFQSHIEDGILSSKFPAAKLALTYNTTCSYWTSNSKRVKSQFVKPLTPEELPPDLSKNKDISMILPNVVVAGTVTRRAVEPTWMTASNPKKNVVGSELKTTIQAPPGYNFVGADVDSQELWIASLMGDCLFGFHGATALGWMTLQGKKADGTDLHSRTAKIMGISRDEAKVFNYSRLYGAGKVHTIQLLLQFNKSLTLEAAKKKADDLYKKTKGVRTKKSKLKYSGGSESFTFNYLENVARSNNPKTPVLGCEISDTLLPTNLKSLDGSPTPFMTSRVNWVVQSSGVDYLHLLLVNMLYMRDILDLGTSTRFVISIHDEIRYITVNANANKVAYALQLSNLLTRCYFAYKLDLYDLPQSVAYFSAVDIDTVLRKEVNLDSVTPSQPTPIPHGKNVDIYELLKNLNLNSKVDDGQKSGEGPQSTVQVVEKEEAPKKRTQKEKAVEKK